MADSEYKTKIVVEGDVSDAEQKLDNLGKTKIKPVEITVAINDEAVKKRLAEIAEANRISMSNAGLDQKNGEKFKIEFLPNDEKVKKALREVTASKHTVIVGMRAKWDDAQKLYKELQKPVQIPVVEKRDPPKKVEHPEETVVVKEKRIPETPVPHAAPQDRQSLERSRRIVAEMRNVGEAANSSAKKTKSAFFAITGSINRAFYALRAFQRVLTGMSIVTSIMIVLNAFKALKAKLDEINTAAARLRWASEMQAAADETARLVGFHEKLAALLRDENDALSKQKSLRDQEQKISDDREDGKRAADRARQIYEAETPEEEQRLRDKFAAEDEQIAASRKKRDRKNRIRDLDEEESAYASKARGLRGNNAEIVKMISDREGDRRRATTDEDRETIDKEIENLRKRKDANDAAIEQYEREAKFRRDQIAVLEGAKDDGGPTAGYWERKTAQKKRDQDAADREWEDKQRKARESDEAARAFVEAYERDKQKDDDAARSRAESALERSYAVGQVSQNRLTALGLGSGVSGNDTMATEMRKVVDLLEQQLVATKENKPEKPGDTNTFTE